MTDEEYQDALRYANPIDLPLSKEDVERGLSAYGANPDDWDALFDYEKPRILYIAGQNRRTL